MEGLAARQSLVAPATLAQQQQLQQQQQQQRTRVPRRLWWFLALSAVSVACFVAELGLSLYIQETDDWKGYSDYKRTETGDVHLTRAGVPRSVHSRSTELTFTIFGNVCYLIFTVVVLLGVRRVTKLPLCRWKAEGYEEPPRSLGRIVMPSFYHWALRRYNFIVSTGLDRLFYGSYEDPYTTEVAYVIIALENFDFFWPVLSPRELLREIIARPGGDHAFGALTYVWTIAVQIVLAIVTARELRGIDLNADDPNQVPVPANQTTWYEYPPAGENARHAVGALLCVQGILTFFMVQLYAYVALSELSEKGFCWKRFDWFKEERYGQRIFNTWPGSKSEWVHAFASIGSLAYDVSNLQIGGEPYAYGILPTWMTRRDDAKPANGQFSTLFWCYTQPAIQFFMCEWLKLADTLQLPDWKAEDLCWERSFPTLQQYIAAIIGMTGSLEEALDLKWLYKDEGKLKLTNESAPTWPDDNKLVMNIRVTPERLRKYMLEMPKGGNGPLLVEILFYDLVTRYGTQVNQPNDRPENTVFEAYVIAHHRGYWQQPFKQTPCVTPRKPSTMVGLSLNESLGGTLFLVIAAIVLFVVAATADRFTAKLTPAILGSLCVLFTPLFASDLAPHLFSFVDKREVGRSEWKPCTEFTMPPQPGYLGIPRGRA